MTIQLDLDMPARPYTIVSSNGLSLEDVVARKEAAVQAADWPAAIHWRREERSRRGPVHMASATGTRSGCFRVRRTLGSATSVTGAQGS